MAVATPGSTATRDEIDRAVAGRTICSIFADREAAMPDEPAIKSRGADGWEALTWREYREAVRNVTLGLIELGFGAGQFALIMARNRTEHVIADLAIVHAGGAAVSLYNTLAPEQIEYIANHCEASVAFVEDEGFFEKFNAIRDKLPHLKHIVLMRGQAAETIAWNDLLSRGQEAAKRDPDAFDRAWRAVKDSDLAALIYTSGTTGPPKGVMYTHHNVVWTCESSNHMLPISTGARTISYLPLSHIAERIATHWLGIHVGSVCHYVPDLTQLLPALVEVRPVFFVGVPRVWEKFYAALNAGMAAEPDNEKRQTVSQLLGASREFVRLEQRGEPTPPDLEARRPMIDAFRQSVKSKIGLDECFVAITSTAPLPVEVEEFFAAVGLPLVEVWGQSEVTGPATTNPAGAVKIGTIGVPYPGMEVKLAQDGELLVRGGNVMVGYYKEPEKTAETIDSEGWVHTGDVGTLDDNGYFRIVDRKKELIITSGGKNISPANVESLLKFHPLVGQACVIGDNRPYLTAVIVLDPEAAPAWAKAHGIQAKSVRQLAAEPAVVAAVKQAVDDTNSHVSRHEQIKKFRILPTEWTAESDELTPTLKLKRRVILEKYRREIDEMYADDGR